MRTTKCVVGLVLTLSVSGWSIQAQEDPRPPAADWGTVLLLRGDALPLINAVPGIGTISAEGLALAEGRFGKAIDFGQGGIASFVLPMAAQPSEQLTLECWVKPMLPSKERLQRIVGRGTNYGFYTDPSGQNLTFFVMAGEWKGIRGRLPMGKWSHIAGTFDGTTIRLYVDGKLVDEAENPGLVKQSTVPYHLGCEGRRSEYHFQGLIDEVRLSKVVRTEFMTGNVLVRPEPTVGLKAAELRDSDFVRTLNVRKTAQSPVIDGKLTDAAWADAQEVEFVTTRTGSRPVIPTSVRAVYDDKALYLGYRCLEKGQETQRHGTAARDDMGIFKTDGVEALLQPGGTGTPYYQFAMNPMGGLFDVRYELPRRMEKWDGPGIHVAGQVEADLWTLEVIIPFADLGVASPTEGTEWRGNFCRNEIPSKELSTWALTGGGFHELERFGVIRFVGGRSADSATSDGSCELRGIVLEADGKPVASIPVKTLSGTTRTDYAGEFVLKGLPAGEVPIQIRSPRYETTMGTVSISRQKEILAPVKLTRVDPYRPAFPALFPERPVVWLKSSIDEAPDMTVSPTEKDLASDLILELTPGEYESRAVAIFANRDLIHPSVTVDSLQHSPNGDYAGDFVRIRWTQRLLKRVQYKRLREDAVFNWRFLWDEAPEQVSKGQIRQLVMTVKAPETTPPGEYSGAMVLRDVTGYTTSLPLKIRIADFRLRTPEKKVGAYYGIRGVTKEQQAIELDDIREHGGSVLIWHASIYYGKDENGEITYDLDHVRESILMQHEHGLGPPYLVGTSPRRAAALAGLKVRMTPEFAEEIRASQEFKRIYREGIQRLDALQNELGVGGFLYTWMDEVFNQGRYDAWQAFAEATREFTKTPIYITFHNRNQEMVDKAAPWVDVRCYHGHTLDWWLGEGHTWDELAKELADDGDVAWTYYNIREIAVTSEWVRLCNGYWLWRSPIMAHVPWKYYHFGGSAFDDLDSDTHDFAYAAPHPDKPEMVSTLEWEAFREGYDDLRYLATLEWVISQAEKAGAAAEKVKEAKKLLTSWWNEEPTVPEKADMLTGNDYIERRRKMIEFTEAILKRMQR